MAIYASWRRPKRTLKVLLTKENMKGAWSPYEASILPFCNNGLPCPSRHLDPRYAHQLNIQKKIIISKIFQMTIMSANNGNVHSKPTVRVQRNSSTIYWCLRHARQFIRDREYKVDIIPTSVLNFKNLRSQKGRNNLPDNDWNKFEPFPFFFFF